MTLATLWRTALTRWRNTPRCANCGQALPHTDEQCAENAWWWSIR